MWLARIVYILRPLESQQRWQVGLVLLVYHIKRVCLFCSLFVASFFPAHSCPKMCFVDGLFRRDDLSSKKLQAPGRTWCSNWSQWQDVNQRRTCQFYSVRFSRGKHGYWPSQVVAWHGFRHSRGKVCFCSLLVQDVFCCFVFRSQCLFVCEYTLMWTTETMRWGFLQFRLWNSSQLSHRTTQDPLYLSQNQDGMRRRQRLRQNRQNPAPFQMASRSQYRKRSLFAK